jgi:hypothetical protein
MICLQIMEKIKNYFLMKINKWFVILIVRNYKNKHFKKIIEQIIKIVI